MKRILTFIYFIGISTLLFLCAISIGKGFYLDGFLRHPLVTIGIGILSAGTLLMIAFSDSDISDEKEKDDLDAQKNSRTLNVGNCEIDNKLIQKVLTDVIYQEDENVKINYELSGQTIDIKVEVKRLDNIKVAEIVKEIENELNKQLNEMFNIKNELTIHFTIIEVGVSVEEEAETVEEDSTSELERTQEEVANSDDENKTTES